MVTAVVKTESTWTLTLTDKEASWLRQSMQNPLRYNSMRTPEENVEERKIREAIFLALHNSEPSPE